jgi:uncharacterized protein DUF4325
MFKLADIYGSVLAGRQPAIEIREEVERLVRAGETVTVDLEGVATMSPSFADELFGKLAANVGTDAVRFEHLEGHLAAIAEMAAAGRSRDDG